MNHYFMIKNTVAKLLIICFYGKLDKIKKKIHRLHFYLHAQQEKLTPGKIGPVVHLEPM